MPHKQFGEKTAASKYGQQSLTSFIKHLQRNNETFVMEPLFKSGT